jgi:negative regulator of replication initiation
MGNGTHLATWVTPDTKERFAATARHLGLSDSALLRRMIELTLRSTDAASLEMAVASDEGASRASRLTVRLRPEDQMLLAERAAARSMAPATYVSVLVRSHLRSLTPLPKDELLALKRAVAELSAIGRNLNQIARVTSQGGRAAALGRNEVMAMLKVAEALRDHMKALLRANERSWSTGHGETAH